MFTQLTIPKIHSVHACVVWNLLIGFKTNFNLHFKTGQIVWILSERIWCKWLYKDTKVNVIFCCKTASDLQVLRKFPVLSPLLLWFSDSGHMKRIICKLLEKICSIAWFYGSQYCSRWWSFYSRPCIYFHNSSMLRYSKTSLQTPVCSENGGSSSNTQVFSVQLFKNIASKQKALVTWEHLC